jgi:hypothetical protein
MESYQEIKNAQIIIHNKLANHIDSHEMAHAEQNKKDI